MWVIVLAAGEGSRMRSLIRLVEHEPLPKQFATLLGSRSLLQATIERAHALAPPRRMIVVVSRTHEATARRQLAEWPEIEILPQPENRGTAFGIMLPLVHLRRRDPEASVAILPSDHYVPRPRPFIDGVRRAQRSPGITLLGIAPDRPEVDLGWIVPQGPIGGGLEGVARFVEKPGLLAAEALFRAGALWNALVVTGRLRDLWALVADHLPEEAAAFDAAERFAAIDALYRNARPTDLSRAVLEKARGLQVARVAGSGWADWGTPERVLDSLDGTPALDHLLQRILEGQRRGGGLTLEFAARVAWALRPSPEAGAGGSIDG